MTHILAYNCFFAMQAPANMVYYRCMSQNDIVCKATTDTFVRFGIVLLALFGFSIYFMYDGAIGYRKANEAYFCHQAFAELGKQSENCNDEAEWKKLRETTPLINAAREGDDLYVEYNNEIVPLPTDCEAATACPEEVMSLSAVKAGWDECWKLYSKRKGMPYNTGEHPYDTASISHQWIGAAVGLLLTAFGFFLVIRTKRRELAIRGQQITAVGRTFNISDIESIDLRQWGKGFKGVAYFTVQGKKLRIDGMTYGGFNPDKGEPAEAFMKAVLTQYKGDIIDYEQPESNSESTGA